MLFDDEREAFQAYAEAMPNNCILLVDTYDTLEGVRARDRGGALAARERRHELAGIRLDSGDLAWLSQEARRLLDEAGFPDTLILASNELDETIIDSLKEQGARIAVWGVGTRLVTGADDGALGGVYKLGAYARRRRRLGPTREAVRAVREDAACPGCCRCAASARTAATWPTASTTSCRAARALRRSSIPLDHTRRREIPAGTRRRGPARPGLPARPAGRTRRRRSRGRGSGRWASSRSSTPGVKRFVNPHQYPVGLEKTLFDLRTRLILEARGLPLE